MSKVNVYKNASQKTYDLTQEQRDVYKRISRESREERLKHLGEKSTLVRPINQPRLDPNDLMPKIDRTTKLRALSLFSGGGGLDLGFDRAGYDHVASYELIPICGETLRRNRPSWSVFAGPDDGDVTKADWHQYEGRVDVVHGGPPCQPFSIAGQQRGSGDERNMWPEFVRCVRTIRPKAFVGENVLGMVGGKFADFIKANIYDAMPEYEICSFSLNASHFGVPQIRRRIFFVGVLRELQTQFRAPAPTHSVSHFGLDKDAQSDLFAGNTLAATMGVREALGLERTNYDALAPTLRSGFTGKRNTTSILNSAAGQRSWGALSIWPNGVQSNRRNAASYPAQNNHFRLSVQDCALLQGFPEDWHFAGAAYQVLGQIGNSVAPPVAYQVAMAVSNALLDA